MQNPYEWGITSAHLIADYLNGDKSKIPADGVIIIPGLTPTKDNVKQFSEDFRRSLPAASPSPGCLPQPVHLAAGIPLAASTASSDRSLAQ